MPHLPLTALAVFLVAATVQAGPDHTPGRRPMTASELKTHFEAFRTSPASAAYAPGQVSAIQIEPFAGHFEDRGHAVLRVNQRVQGIRIWGGDLILSGPKAQELDLVAGTPASQRLAIETQASLSEAEVIALAQATLGGSSVPAFAPKVERIIYPMFQTRPKRGLEHLPSGSLDATQVEKHLVEGRLAYHVMVGTYRPGGPDFREFILCAHTGSILAQWSGIRTAEEPATASMKYFYRPHGTTSNVKVDGAYWLYDPQRGHMMVNGAKVDGFGIYDMNGRWTGSADVMKDFNTDNLWGSGTAFDGNYSAQRDTYQTPAIDAYRSIQVTYDMLLNVFNFRGMDGNGLMPSIFVHVGDSQNGTKGYDNAYYTLNTLNFGDGLKYFLPMTSMDISAHEFGHGVCEKVAGLVYRGESGGLNEANSDILATLAEYYENGAQGQGSRIPDSGGNFMVGEQVGRPGGSYAGRPLRWMDRPSKDGVSKDAWYSGIGSIDVHFSSGPANRMFYFLAKGAGTSASTPDTYSTHLPKGMRGLGLHRAGKIWFKALADYMTSTTDYAQARVACEKAATDLYGKTSNEYWATQAAFKAINVGTDVVYPQPPDSQADQPPTLSDLRITSQDPDFLGPLTLGATAGDDKAVESVTFLVDGTQVGTDTQAPYEVVLPAGSLPQGPHTLKVVARDSAGQTTEASKSFTVGPPPSDTAPPVVTQPQAQVQGTSVTLSAQVTDNVGVTSVEFLVDGTAVKTFTQPPYSHVLSGLAPGNHAFTVKALDAAGNPGQGGPVAFTITGQSERIANGTFEAGATGWAGSTGVIDNWTSQGQPAFEGLKAAYLGGNGKQTTETLYQIVSIPATATGATLTFMLHIDSVENYPNLAMDTLAVSVRSTTGTLLRTLATYSNMNQAPGYQKRTFDLSQYKGKTVQIHFLMKESPLYKTNFLVDAVSLAVR